MLDPPGHTPSLDVRVGRELEHKRPMDGYEMWSISGSWHDTLRHSALRLRDMVSTLGYKHSDTEPQQS